MRVFLIEICFAGIAFAVFMLIRNHAVFTYRRRICEIIFSADVFDYQWRLKIYKSVTYNDMMLRFWKPLDTFYPDKDFLNLNVHAAERLGRGYVPERDAETTT